jgi:hypothetical protein
MRLKSLSPEEANIMKSNKRTIHRHVRWDRLITVTLILAALIISISMVIIRRNAQDRLAPIEPPASSQHDDSVKPDFDVTPGSQGSKLMRM